MRTKRIAGIGLVLGLLLIMTGDALAFYNPQTGRWLSRDPIGERGGKLVRSADGSSKLLQREDNLYMFVANLPVGKIDAFGLAIVGADACLQASPEDSKSSVCGRYGDRRHMGVGLACFCRCAGDSDWSQAVRGCLACMDAMGVDITTAHISCYEAVDKKYSRPNAAIAWCTCRCH